MSASAAGPAGFNGPEDTAGARGTIVITLSGVQLRSPILANTDAEAAGWVIGTSMTGVSFELAAAAAGDQTVTINVVQAGTSPAGGPVSFDFYVPYTMLRDMTGVDLTTGIGNLPTGFSFTMQLN